MVLDNIEAENINALNIIESNRNYKNDIKSKKISDSIAMPFIIFGALSSLIPISGYTFYLNSERRANANEFNSIVQKYSDYDNNGIITIQEEGKFYNSFEDFLREEGMYRDKNNNIRYNNTNLVETPHLKRISTRYIQ